MTIEILMPALSPTMTEGTLSAWIKQEGDAIYSGDVIAEIETDKATMEVEAVEAGVLGKILVSAGTENVPVNNLIAILLEEGEDASSIIMTSTLNKPEVTSPLAQIKVPDNIEVSQSEGPKKDRTFASPLAKRLASQFNIDLTSIKGSGPRGRIVKRDLESVGSSQSNPVPLSSEQPASQSVEIAKTKKDYEEIPNSSIRKVIARRLTESKRDVPHFYLSLDCKLDELLDLRKNLNLRDHADYKISVNDFIIKAVSLALRKVPAANASWTDEAIRLYNNIDVSVAVATSDGLITPIVRKADTKGLSDISTEMKSLITKAKEGKLKPEEFQGGGFTISNLGMFGIKEFSAIINPPQSCILAIGAGEQRTVVIDGDVKVATVMTCTLSVDHRSVDGAVGAKFLSVFKKIIEDPLTMLL